MFNLNPVRVFILNRFLHTPTTAVLTWSFLILMYFIAILEYSSSLKSVEIWYEIIMFQTKDDDDTQGNKFNELKFIKNKFMKSKSVRICTHKDLTKMKSICNTAKFAHYHGKESKVLCERARTLKDKNTQSSWCARIAVSNSVNHRRHGEQLPGNVKTFNHLQPLKPQPKLLTILTAKKRELYI